MWVCRYDAICITKDKASHTHYTSDRPGYWESDVDYAQSDVSVGHKNRRVMCRALTMFPLGCGQTLCREPFLRPQSLPYVGRYERLVGISWLVSIGTHTSGWSGKQ